MTNGARGPLLFVAADPRECTGLVDRWDTNAAADLPVHWARRGTWQGSEVIAVVNGAGAERARAAVKAVPGASAVCNIGFCGALVESLRAGDVFVATEIRDGSDRWEAKRPKGPAAASAPSGQVASINHVAQTAKEKRDLRATGASIVEMEAAGVARAAEEMGVPFYCVRVVSDAWDEDLANDYNRALLPDGRFSVARLIVGALGSPVKRFGELIRLGQRTAVASKNLGEFLGNCIF